MSILVLGLVLTIEPTKPAEGLGHHEVSYGWSACQSSYVKTAETLVLLCLCVVHLQYLNSTVKAAKCSSRSALKADYSKILKLFAKGSFPASKSPLGASDSMMTMTVTPFYKLVWYNYVLCPLRKAGIHYCHTLNRESQGKLKGTHEGAKGMAQVEVGRHT